EMRSRIKEEDQSVPMKKGDYLYYSKTLKDHEYPIYCRKKNVEGSTEEILVDVNELGKGFDTINVPFPGLHFEQNLMAYAVDTKGDRIFNIYFKDLKTGKLLDQKIEHVTENFVWAEAGRVLYYVKHDPTTLRANQVFKYDLDTKNNILIYEEKDEKFEVMVYKTEARHFIFITSNSTLSSEVRFALASDLKAKFKVISPREKNLEYRVSDGVEDLYILTNWNAKNFRVMKVGASNPEKKNWQEVIAHRGDVFIEGLDVFKDYLSISERSKGLTQINVLKRKDLIGCYINFPDAAYTVSAGGSLEYDNKLIRYEFESMNRPSSVFEFDVEKKESKLLKEKMIPTYDSSKYTSERVFAMATDGTQIPVSIVYKKGLNKDGSAPLFVYGYGSYGMSTDPYFSSARVSLLDRGFVFAIIHVRGGSEMGRGWYDDGKFFKKKNTFSDFISGTEFLTKEKYADPRKVFANGGSAGGLLMGAIVNMRPDLYRGVIADVPFVDVVTTMLDSSLPLTTGEYEEWGNPNNKKYYEYMKSYAPYDNVSAQDYPNLLVTTGLNDSQVPFWEPTKWVSKIRELRTDKSKLLLMKIEMDVGHGGKSGRFEYLRDEALSYAFIFKILGINY
ncbi:MAG: S9 family peptidase, partial [Bdellovibrionales bacterium]|nr:S9 family peptidase [Bdellovibrionales bacterium]